MVIQHMVELCMRAAAALSGDDSKGIERNPFNQVAAHVCLSWEFAAVLNYKARKQCAHMLWCCSTHTQRNEKTLIAINNNYTRQRRHLIVKAIFSSE